MTDSNPPTVPTEPETAVPEEPVRSASTGIEETGHASFPASDPPAVWTWEVKKD
jgi:hypothetical protein